MTNPITIKRHSGGAVSLTIANPDGSGDIASVGMTGLEAGNLGVRLMTEASEAAAEVIAGDVASLSAQQYTELCDLFDQAIFMGRDGTFDAQPDTDPERLYMTSPQARRFVNAAVRALGLTLADAA